MHRITGAKTFERKEIQNKTLHNHCRKNKLAKLRRCGSLIKGLKHIELLPLDFQWGFLQLNHSD